ncbi:MAG: hypothetical protein WC718_09465 [Phycisphaerales bacterium]|jgi:hypothetical protein
MDWSPSSNICHITTYRHVERVCSIAAREENRQKYQHPKPHSSTYFSTYLQKINAQDRFDRSIGEHPQFRGPGPADANPNTEASHTVSAATHKNIDPAASEPPPAAPIAAPPDRAMGPTGTGWHIDVMA